MCIYLRGEFVLNWKGVHGFNHWVRVRMNGLKLAELNGANQKVIELFAFLHDIRREQDFGDPNHGKRAIDVINKINGNLFQLTDAELEDLKTACEFHSRGLVGGNITVQTCWDADRLDLGRVGIKPIKEMLCTSQAKTKEMMDQAYRRSISGQ